MKISDLVFLGIKGSVVALNRATGEQVWATHLKGSDFVNIVVQNETVFASCYGEIFRLDPSGALGCGASRSRLRVVVKDIILPPPAAGLCWLSLR